MPRWFPWFNRVLFVCACVMAVRSGLARDGSEFAAWWALAVSRLSLGDALKSLSLAEVKRQQPPQGG